MLSDQELEDLWNNLTSTFGIDDFFYSVYDLADLPRGHLTDVAGSVSILEMNNLPATRENVYHVMTLKKELFEFLQEDKKTLSEIDEASKGRVGWGGIPPPYDYAVLLALLTLLWHFSKGFFTRSGELLAEKAFGHLEEKTGHKIPEEERNLLAKSCENIIKVKAERVEIILSKIEQ